MHLLASQPGGFVDDEGIVDLQQSSADLVVLSAADSGLAALAQALDSLPDDYPSVRLANWMQLVKPAAYDLYEHKVLEHARVVVVSLLGGKGYWEYGIERLLAWQRRASKDAPRHLILVPGDDSVDLELQCFSSADSVDVQRVWRYLREGGASNGEQLLNFLADRFLGRPSRWLEPAEIPSCLLYAPEYLRRIQGLGQVATLHDWQRYWQGDKQFSDNSPVALLLFYRSHLQGGNTQVFDDFLAVCEGRGLKVLPVVIASLKDELSLSTVQKLVGAVEASVVINTTSFSSNRVSSPELCSEPTEFMSPLNNDLPVLQLILSGSTEQDWLEQKQGLRSRDIAMQIVLPEMDGRVISRAISFKNEAYFCQRAQLPVIQYLLHKERAQFVADLAVRYAQLANKPARDKRVALILANYPTKDGRIGNGVGLDTPASVIAILKAMQVAGYPVVDIPVDGNALIEALLGSITNNPDTLTLLPCWQSLSLADYKRSFAQLPEDNQQAVLQRWGQPEADPKYRQGRLMLAGIRLGETFVGIQPARGFNMDLAANYHDPDLVPPHSYLAYYFWLRDVYQIDAVVHVGKHGNLEWLPGKGTALSEFCWPDQILGPLPNFYPFIVNDPGEGAQAKRRTQAVVVDHLMPPMARAETYGDLAQLENRVDEYYQALGLDERRAQWLREQILLLVRQTGVLQELSVNLDVEQDDDVVLEELDAYLCEIKEAQIRHGLHRLGELPEPSKLAETLVALLRLPRGNEGMHQGILHALAVDLELYDDDQYFNPLAAEQQSWSGARPDVLLQVSQQAWRTQFDTRERLELLAQQWVQHYVLDNQPMESDWQEQFPSSAAVLLFARNVLLNALHESASNEVDNLLRGLAGKFVAPGPSGAPTRGRLDTLPTGRNFFSVDNRSIPSPAAWALGQQSAQALIERHLQEKGDFPKQIGLSVWGTATMRTGGDDIAQAFALMGIKPVWAEGSQRVVDFEIVPAQLLGRPRVDVTLRVSGFFRDAFPNVMRLYDAAVVALAEFEEPGDGNSIRQHIQQTRRQLQQAGMSEADAFRQASYRVFGSKPGAYGAGLQGLIDERCWEDSQDLAQAYLNWGGYAYGKHRLDSNDSSADGVAAHAAFQYRLSQLEAVVQNQDNREHDLLDSDDYYQFQGGMSNAVRQFSGNMPTVYHSDHANPAAPKIRTLKEELNRVIRSRVLNPKWLAAMREHGYKGAFEMAASVDYLFAYDATTDLVDDYQYELVADALVFDPDNQAFLQDNNPHALEEMAERLLEAAQRGLWREPGAKANDLQQVLLDLEQRLETSGAISA